MSGDFGGFGGGFGFDPEWMRMLAAQWQNAAAQPGFGAGMDMAKMGAAPAMPLPAAGASAPTAAPEPAPITIGDQRREQTPGLLDRLMGAGAGKGADDGRGRQDMMAALRGLGGGSARPAGGGSGAAAPPPAPAGHRPQGGGALPMREPTTGNPYLRRRRGLLDDDE